MKFLKDYPIKNLKPFERNARKNDEAAKKLTKIIEKRGYRDPIQIDENGVVLCGHTRLKALKQLGTEKVDVIMHDDFKDEKEKNEYRVEHNKTTEFADWDMDILLKDFNKDWLKELDFDLTELEPEQEITEDEAPEVPETPKTVRGDIYELGNHRVMCGDSTLIDDVEKLMNGKKADMVFTSPPYNANTKTGEGDIFNGKKSKKLYAEGYSDNLDSNKYLDFVKTVLDNCFMFTEGFIFWNVSYNANSRFEYIKQIVDKLEFLIEQICWKKSSTIPFKGSLMRDFEPIYLFSTNGKLLGLESVVSNHWEISNTNSQQTNHKACFPVELPAKAINLIKDSNIVLDTFLGSGSTLIACEQTNRICYGMELDEKYCDVIVQRYVNFTGNTKIKRNGEEIEWEKSDK